VTSADPGPPPAPPPDLPPAISRMWEADRASRELGIEIVEVAPGSAKLRMRIRDDMVNGHGMAHGGMVFSLADSAFAVACNSHGPVTVAHSATIRFLEPVRLGSELFAVAIERSREGRRGVYDVEVRAGDVVVATFEGRATTLREAGPADAR
jgi:acyl-CoA thioesterase